MNTPARTPRRSNKITRFLENIEDAASKIENRMFAEMYVTAARNKVLHNDTVLYDFMRHIERMPVSIEEFLDSKEFLGATDMEIWPEVRKAIIEINQNWWKGVDHGAIIEAIMSGATGTAKSTISMISLMYHTHLLGCLKVPQRIYGYAAQTSIVIPIMGAKPNVVNKVVYAPMKKFIEAMPWFQKHMPHNKLVDSEIEFKEKNVRIIKAGGDEDQILGEAVIGGMIDEINFMAVVARSKKAEVSTGRAGMYDQATQVHHRMVTRRKGRFGGVPGNHPSIGIIFPSSSTRYKGDFTDKREAFVRKHKGTPEVRGIYIYNRIQFRVQPAKRYEGKPWFRLVVPNAKHHDIRVLEEHEPAPKGAEIILVPEMYKTDFKSKPYDTLRDVLGLSHNAMSPFIKTRHKVIEAVDAGREAGLKSFLVKDHVILGIDGMPQVKVGHYCYNPSRPRYVHIDLSRNGDRCGVSMVCFDGLIEIARQDDNMMELMPKGRLEMALSIEPDANNEIDIAEVRAFVQRLKKDYGYPIKGVSYDGFDSRESIQAWRKSGVRAKLISVDRTSVPYKQLRDATYDGRFLLLDDDVVVNEFLDLEYDSVNDKIDHPVTGSKDVIDSVCGAYTNMIEHRSTWAASAGGSATEHRFADEERFDGARR